jgi:aryl-alcohol dehydrogenase-like predicted oxidoreductase
MIYNVLGNSELKVSALTLGSYHIYDRTTPEQAAELLRAAVDAGINWFDVGHYTSAAHPEERVSTTDIRFARARAAAGIARSDYIHTEKLWYGGPRPTFKAQFAESLPRAEVDYADLAIYNPDTAYYFDTPVDMEDIVCQMAGLIEIGWAKHWGINHATPSEVRQACEFAAREGMPAPTVLQLPYSAVARKMAEDCELEAVAAEYHLAYQASNTLAVGVLAGRPAAQAERPLGPDALTEHAGAVAAEFAALAASVDATPAQLAIAFALSHPMVANALVGVSKLEQLRDNLGALDVLERLGRSGIRDLLAQLPQNEREWAVGQIAD